MNIEERVMERPITKEELIYSRLGEDPDLGEIVTMFVDEMPDRMASLERQFQAQDWESLRRSAHQLKGAAGSYGFDAISPVAGRLESAVRDQDPVDQIHATVEEILDLCRRVRSGGPS
jgi:histidine phosphotransfer protein HptB